MLIHIKGEKPFMRFFTKRLNVRLNGCTPANMPRPKEKLRGEVVTYRFVIAAAGTLVMPNRIADHIIGSFKVRGAIRPLSDPALSVSEFIKSKSSQILYSVNRPKCLVRIDDTYLIVELTNESVSK